MKKSFTLIELVVAVALLAIVFSFAGVIFKVSIDSYRTACANAEIIQKLRAITDQLNADFKGLRKDGEIFVIWEAKELDASAAQYDDYRDCDKDGYERFDRIMFFADGDFQSYEPYKGGILDRSGEPIRGDVARICYMLANKPPPPADIGVVPPERPGDYSDPILSTSLTEQGRKYREEKRRGRILSRTQHILTADTQFKNAPLTPTGTNPQDWYNWNSIFEYEYDMNSLDKWKNVSWVNKQDMLTVITDTTVQPSTVFENIRGTMVDPADANLIHNLLCEGVGEFKVQGWSWDNVQRRWRWVPEVDPDGDGNLADSEFFLGSTYVPGVLYPYRAWLPLTSYVQINNISYPDQMIDEAHFNEIPGLGRALKFTFTLYDSKGVIKEGRTFTHIVYLGN
jgi:prepilin-type N-terminal cleavage/methylation domain-containing protein